MDSAFGRRLPEEQQHPAYHGGYPEAPYAAGRAVHAAPEAAQPDFLAPRWTSPHGYDRGSGAFGYSFPPPSSGVGGFGAPGLAPPYSFDPSVPPPPLGCPPPGHFAPVAPAYSSSGVRAGPTPRQQFGPGPQSGPYDAGPRPQECPGRSASHWKERDEAAAQREQDRQWLRRFLQRRDGSAGRPRSPRAARMSVPELRATLHAAARLVSTLSESCETLKIHVEDESAWTHSYPTAARLKAQLQENLTLLSDECLDGMKAKLSRIAKRRAGRRRARKALEEEERRTEARAAGREAAIDEWRMQQIRQVEERKKEQELKLAADSVLCEVRKKQADMKRMQDLLRSLEKLRKLRKEAASRKGIFTEQECEEAFSRQLEELRSVMRTRTNIYSAEEKALLVMLEGEQEEERRREAERRLLRRRKVDAMLFGGPAPADPSLQPFLDYYSQAEVSLAALVQIRSEWDVFLVAADHPDGATVPPGWVLPDAPSDPSWASALLSADPDRDDL